MEIILQANFISKSFPGVKAVDGVSLELRKGEILALVGENGAGKSTLTQILGGAQKPDVGEIILDGKPVSFTSSDQAILAGISIIYQELSLVGSLSIAENIYANRHPVGPINNILWGKLYQQTQELLDRFELDLSPAVRVKYLSMGQQQIIEILKAISINPKVLILDEPTSSLTEREISYLFTNIRKLREQGISFIYITHKLSEVFELADRVMVMRDGKYINCLPIEQITENDLISMMVGRKIENLYGARVPEYAETEWIMRVEDFSKRWAFQDVNFDLRKGEILGFAGLIGAGRTGVGRAIAGIDQKDSGKLYLNEKEIKIHSPMDAIHHNIAYLTKDRKGDGLFLDMSLRDNLIAPSIDKFATAIGFLDRRSIDAHAEEKVKEFDIATTSITKKVLYLSGGSQQKVLVAMWTGIRPRVIIFDEPTRGVDVGSKAEIYQLLRRFAAENTSIIMISSDLPELIGMCDRILVFHRGRISGEILRKDFTEERILTLASGLQLAVENGNSRQSKGGN
ncbi:MAG: sugar ABC transporter ATP-binding protein [Peptococcaceae bacterium]|nr:sugar ABC transporter ATP-binding protein [Peptococcaceae bacterium]